jgi:hypothetical protein
MAKLSTTDRDDVVDLLIRMWGVCDDREDVDDAWDGYGEPRPNVFMRLKGEIDEMLARLGKAAV